MLEYIWYGVLSVVTLIGLTEYNKYEVRKKNKNSGKSKSNSHHYNIIGSGWCYDPEVKINFKNK